MLCEVAVAIGLNVKALVLELFVVVVPPVAVKAMALARGVEEHSLLILPEVSRLVWSSVVLICLVEIEELDHAVLLLPSPRLRVVSYVNFAVILPINLEAELLSCEVLREGRHLRFAAVLRISDHADDFVTIRVPSKNLHLVSANDDWALFLFLCQKLIRSEVQDAFI